MRYTPSVDEGERAYIDGLSGTSRTRAESAAEYRRMIAAVERAAAEKAVANVRSEIRQIPRWWNPELGYGEFDLQPLGPNETSEKGAYMEVMRVLDECAAALGLTAGQERENDE